MNLTQCIRGGSQDKRAGFIIAFPYNQDIVETLKRTIPHIDREWQEDSKTWWVNVKYEWVLKSMFSNFEALVYLQGTLW